MLGSCDNLDIAIKFNMKNENENWRHHKLGSSLEYIDLNRLMLNPPWKHLRRYDHLLYRLETFFAGISPCFVKWSNGLLVLGTQFAGGVFLGTATMHFLSDSNETFQDKTTKEYPFAFMLACAGYLLTMLGDCVIQWIFDKESKYTLPSKVDTEKGKMLI